MCNPFRDIARTAFGLVLAATERAVPFDEARAEAWLKTTAAADALADREAEEEVAEPRYASYVDGNGVIRTERAGDLGDDPVARAHRLVSQLADDVRFLTQTSAASAGAGEGPTEVSARPDPAAPSVGCWPPVALTAAEVRDVRALLAAEHATEFDWQAWAIPAITDVLTEHTPLFARSGQNPIRGYIRCVDAIDVDEPLCREFAEWEDWRDHTADLIAERIHQAAAHQAQQ